MTFDRKMVYGLNETGKSVWAREFLADKEYIIWSPNPDDLYIHQENRLQIVYRPKDRFSPQELNDFLGWIFKTKAFHGRGLWIVFDEAHDTFPNLGGLSNMPPNVKLLFSSARHKPFNFNTMFIAFRPQEIDPKIDAKALSMTVFRVTGANNVKRLNNTQAGMGDAAEELDNFHFLTWESGTKGFKTNEPITLSNADGDRGSGGRGTRGDIEG